MSIEVPEVARDLYAAPPEGFVASRNALAKQLKADGDDATAAIVAKLRRPTVSAAAVNTAAREHPDLVGELLDAGERLAGVQRKLLSGRSGAADELRTVSDERRRLVRALADAAIDRASVDGRSVDHLRDEIAGTFEAATLDDDLGQRLRDGTVEKAVTPSAGLSGLEGFAVIPGGAAGSEEQEEPAKDGSDDASSRMQRAAAEAAEEAARARADADAAIEAAARAAEDAARLAEAADAAERAARDARAEERRMRDEASTAKRRAERAERAAKSAADRAAR